MVSRLRGAYLSSEYEEDVWNNIRNRTQGVGERVAIYIAMMENLFNKLSTKPTEETRVRMIKRNLLPDLQRQLSLLHVDTLSDLLDACQQVEDVENRASRIRPPPTNHSLVTERDLMFRRARPQVSAVAAEVHEVNTVLCWNCRSTGHLHRVCPQPRQRQFCFRCSQDDVTTNTCPKCRLNSRQRRQ